MKCEFCDEPVETLLMFWCGCSFYLCAAHQDARADIDAAHPERHAENERRYAEGVERHEAGCDERDCHCFGFKIDWEARREWLRKFGLLWEATP